MQDVEHAIGAGEFRGVPNHIEPRRRQADARASARKRIGITDKEERRRRLAVRPYARRKFEADPGGIAHRDGERLHAIIDA